MNNYVMCSGGFDPLHVGHLRLFKAASHFGLVLVVLNSDAWLMRKKGEVCWSIADRWELLLGLRSVSLVVDVEDVDDTVCAAIHRWHPRYFANGGDRTPDNSSSAEVALCQQLGIELLWNVGGTKVRSSQELCRR